MRRWLLMGWVTWTTTAASPAPPAPTPLEAEVHGLWPIVQATRGLPLSHVPITTATPQAFRAKLLADLGDDEGVQDLADTSATLQAFGLAPPQYDVRANTLDVLTAQLGGYYDPETRRLVLIAHPDTPYIVGNLSPEDRLVASHELMHAAQDQRYDLWSLTHRTFNSDDVEMAIRAYVEGEAEYAVLVATFPHPRTSLSTTDVDRFRANFVGQRVQGPFEGPVAAMPPVLRDALMFPYLEAVAFAHTVVHERGWEAIDRGYAHPPLSTEQILHPYKFLQQDDPPLMPVMPDLERLLGHGWTLEVEDTFGELGIRALLRTRAPSLPLTWASRAAEGWGGDRYQVYRHRDDRLAAVWATRWDTTRDAEEFSRSLVRVADGPEQKRRARKRGATGWSVHLEGTDVTVLVDVPAPDAAHVVDRLRNFAALPLTSLDAVSTPRPEPRAVP